MRRPLHCCIDWSRLNYIICQTVHPLLTRAEKKYILLSHEQWCYYHIVLRIRKDLRGKLKLKSPLPRKDCCCTIWWKTSGQLYSFTAQLIQFEVMKKKHLTTVTVHEECYIICFHSTQINFRHVFKMLAFGTSAFWVVNATGQWMRQCALFNAMPNVFLHNWKEWVIRQTKYCTNVITMSVSGRKQTIKSSRNRCHLANMANMNVIMLYNSDLILCFAR